MTEAATSSLPSTPSIVPPEVQKFLEAVFAVAPHPEEYVLYRLHLATALSPAFLTAWFDTRRMAAREQGTSASQAMKPNGTQATSTENPCRPIPTQAFSLFDGNSRAPLSYEQRSLALLASTNREVQDVSRLLTMMQNGHWDKSSAPAPSMRQIQQACDTTGSDFSGEAQQTRHCANGQHPETYDVSELAVRSDGEAVPSNRFTEADLHVISKLVGLETINSKEAHCGSTSLYMFEQLTALDSLDPDGASGMKRKRTRHQHFWRNTDKLDPRDRVYVPTASLRPALSNNQPVMSKTEISPDERTNSWTVCLTTSGVVGYLNKRISPLGVQMIRALASKCKGQVKVPEGTSFQNEEQDNDFAGFRQVKPKLQATRQKSPSSSEGVSISDGGRENARGEAFEPAPRVRRRKP